MITVLAAAAGFACGVFVAFASVGDLLIATRKARKDEIATLRKLIAASDAREAEFVRLREEIEATQAEARALMAGVLQ